MDIIENSRKICMKLSKTSTNKWLINQEDNAGGEENRKIQSLVAQAKEERSDITKPTVRVSLPIKSLKIMNPTNEGKKDHQRSFNSPLNMTEMFRQPPPAHRIQSLRPPAPVSAAPLRSVRHPVPTGKIRTSMANRTNPVQFPIPPPPPTSTNQMAQPQPTSQDLTIPPTKLHTHTTIAPVNKIAGVRANETEISYRHNLPHTVEGYKSSIAKENLAILSDVATTRKKCAITVSNFTQTDNVIIISENDNNLLTMIKKSDITMPELEKELIKLKKWTLSKDSEIIDLVNNSDETDHTKHLYSTLLEHSRRNKAELLTSYIIKGVKVPGSPALPEGSPSVPTKVQTPPRVATPFPKNRHSNELVESDPVPHVVTNPPTRCYTSSTCTIPTMENQNGRHTFTLRNINNDEVQEYIAAIVKLNDLKTHLTHKLTSCPLPEQSSQTVEVTTPRGYGSTALQYPSAARLLPPMQEMAIPHQQLLFQPSVPPPQIQPCQMPPPQMPPPQIQSPQMPQNLLLNYGQDRPVMNIGTRLEQQRYPMVNNYQSSHQNNRPTILSQQQLLPPQYVNNDPRRHSAQTSMLRGQTPHRMSHVMSTDEANLHTLHNGRVLQSPGTYPYSLYDRPNHYWPDKKA